MAGTVLAPSCSATLFLSFFPFFAHCYPPLPSLCKSLSFLSYLPLYTFPQVASGLLYTPVFCCPHLDYNSLQIHRMRLYTPTRQYSKCFHIIPLVHTKHTYESNKSTSNFDLRNLSRDAVHIHIRIVLLSLFGSRVGKAERGPHAGGRCRSRVGSTRRRRGSSRRRVRPADRRTLCSGSRARARHGHFFVFLEHFLFTGRDINGPVKLSIPTPNYAYDSLDLLGSSERVRSTSGNRCTGRRPHLR